MEGFVDELLHLVIRDRVVVMFRKSGRDPGVRRHIQGSS